MGTAVWGAPQGWVQLGIYLLVHLGYFPVYPSWFSLIFRFLISPWSCDIILMRAVMSNSLDDRWLAYYVTWDMRVTLESVRFVTALLSSDVY